jgi:hypothetical protein
MWKAVLLFVAAVALLASCSCEISMKPDQRLMDAEYERGMHACMDCMMLLNYELELKGEKKTWGEMTSICRSRLIRAPKEQP